MDVPYPLDIVPLFPEFLTRRRVRWTYPLRLMEDLGLDRPALMFLVGGVALQPDEGARLPDITNPYASSWDASLAAASAARAAGLIDEVGGRWHATAKGREVYARFRREQDAYLGTLEPIPASDLSKLASLLAKALDAIERSGVPKDHLARMTRYRTDGRAPMVALDNAVFGLWQARDDCHMAAWRAAGFNGPTFDVLTRVWRDETATEDELAKRLSPQQRPDDVASSLAALRREGYIRAETLAITERGAAVRRAIEDETDRAFFAPWPEDVGAQAAWLRDRLAAVNASFVPAS